MSDIVERLRGSVMWYSANAEVIMEAANEIEKLRAALRDIRDMGPMAVDDQRWRIARAALEEK